MIPVVREGGAGLQERLGEKNIRTVGMELVDALADIGWIFDADSGQNRAYCHYARFCEQSLP